MIAPSSWPSPARGCVATTENRIVIPNECEGSKTDFSLWSKRGFLPAVEMTERPTGAMFPVLRHSLKGEDSGRAGYRELGRNGVRIFDELKKHHTLDAKIQSIDR